MSTAEAPERIDLKASDEGVEFSVHTSGHYEFVVRRKPARVLDIRDWHFHPESAVFLPDFPGAYQGEMDVDTGMLDGLTVLANVFRHAENESGRSLFIAGHCADASLSELRAKSVECLLTQDRESWVNMCLRQSSTVDYQYFLLWVDTMEAWGCNPGPLDDIRGPLTRAATEAFQAEYNEAFGAAILVDGIVGSQTWGAFFDVSMAMLAEAMEIDAATLASRSKGLRFVDRSTRSAGCAADHPLTKNPIEDRISEEDDRVEVVFVDQGVELDVSSCHPAPGKCDPSSCELYSPQWFRLSPLAYEPLETSEPFLFSL